MRVVCAALLVVGACHRASAPPPAEGPREASRDSAGIGVAFAQVAVKLLDAGSEPRSLLLIRGAPNAVQNLTLAADYVLTKDGEQQADYAIAMRSPGQARQIAHDEPIGSSHRAFHGTGGAHASGFMIVLDDLDVTEPGRACTVRGPVDVIKDPAVGVLDTA